MLCERFKSALLEGGEVLAAVAAYVELNPVRAGLCADPKDYRYSGYAEAFAKGSLLGPSSYQNHSGPAGDAAILAIYSISEVASY